MNKAILVLDNMPVNCERCPMSVLGSDKVFCMVLEDWTDMDKRNSDCPLHYLPDHMPENLAKDDGFVKGYTKGVIHGYNRAIKEICGEED